MDAFKCDECRAIYQDLRKAYRAATEDTRDRHQTSQQIANWVQQLSEEECARIRETSSVWKDMAQMARTP
jgi:DNA-binding transcriptional regulator YiaG